MMKKNFCMARAVTRRILGNNEIECVNLTKVLKIVFIYTGLHWRENFIISLVS